MYSTPIVTNGKCQMRKIYVTLNGNYTGSLVDVVRAFRIIGELALKPATELAKELIKGSIAAVCLDANNIYKNMNIPEYHAREREITSQIHILIGLGFTTEMREETPIVEDTGEFDQVPFVPTEGPTMHQLLQEAAIAAIRQGYFGKARSILHLIED